MHALFKSQRDPRIFWVPAVPIQTALIFYQKTMGWRCENKDTKCFLPKLCLHLVLFFFFFIQALHFIANFWMSMSVFSSCFHCGECQLRFFQWSVKLLQESKHRTEGNWLVIPRVSGLFCGLIVPSFPASILSVVQLGNWIEGILEGVKNSYVN